MKKLGRTLVKVFFSLLMIGGIAGAAIFQGGWGAVKESHPALASQELVPLIPIRDFFANTSGVWGYSLSPDGKWMSWEEVEGTKSVVRIAAADDLSNAKTIHLPQGVRHRWHPDSIGLLITSGSYYRGVKIHFADTRPEKFQASSKEWKDITPSGMKRWSLSPKTGNDPWLAISDDRTPGRSDVFTVGADGVGRTELRRNDGTVSQWLVNGQNKVIGRFVKLDDTTYSIQADPEQDDRNWRALGTFTAFDAFYPFVFTDYHWIAVSNRGRDHTALVKVDLDTGLETVIYEDPKKSVDYGIALSSDPDEVDYVAMGSGEPEYIALSDKGERLLAALDDVSKPFNFNILSITDENDLVTVAISEREDSWFYRQINLETGKTEHLGDYDLRRYKDDFAETQFMKIKARDGLEIPVLLTLPKGIDAKNLPMVVLAHGGPSSHVSWGYHHETQFLANRGYAVLNVNYRGSTGFGKSFQEAGYLEFGRKMQDDFVDAAKAMIDQGIADKDKIAIYGASMGGYSAMMGVARDPNFFAAGISVVGVSDWIRDLKTMPEAWFKDAAYINKYFGNPENPADLEALRANSPLTLVDQVKAPILISHGEQDPIVNVEQSRLFEAGLKRNGIEHIAIYYSDEGHGYRKWQNQIDWHRRLEDFLAKHLGGRSGGFDYTEIGAKFL